MDIFPPILTNRSLPPKQQTASTSNADLNTNKKKIVEIDNDNIEHTPNKQQKMASTDETGLIPRAAVIGKKFAADFEKIPPDNNKFYYKFSSKNLAEEDNEDEEEDSQSEWSDFVENDWSDLDEFGGGENGTKQRSREAQEAELQNRYREAMKKLRKQEFEQAMATFATILVHPLMKKYYVPDWDTFGFQQQGNKSEEWAQNGECGGIGTGKIMLTNLAKIYFNVNLAMALLIDDSVPFFMQALSICPQFDDLWFNCGSVAFKQGDWRTAKFCFSRCANEFRAMEALLLAHFMDNEFAECFHLLKNIFHLHPEHQIGHVIRQQIAATSPFWAELGRQTFNRQIVEFQPNEEEEKNKVLLSIRQFREKWEEQNDNKDDDDDHGQFNNLFRKEFEEQHRIQFSPLTVKLHHGMGIEALGKLLCDIFDRIEMFATFTEQEICFQIDNCNDDDEILMFAPESNDNEMVVDETIHEFHNLLEADNPNKNATELDAENAGDLSEKLDRIVEQMATNLTSEMLEMEDRIVDDENGQPESNEFIIEESQEHGGKNMGHIIDELTSTFTAPNPTTALESASQGEDTDSTNPVGTLANAGDDVDGHPKKILIKGKQQKRNRKKLQQILAERAAAGEYIEESAIVRRSLRLLIDNDLAQAAISSPSNNEAKEDGIGSGGEWTVLKIMDLDDPNLFNELNKLMHPPKLALFQMDLIEANNNDNDGGVECFCPTIAADNLIDEFVEASSSTFNEIANEGNNNSRNIRQCMMTYLKFISNDWGRTAALTLEQAEVYRQVYSRWSAAFNTTSTTMPLSTQLDIISIHQFAAELGSHRALSIVRAHFEQKYFMEEELIQNDNGKISFGKESQERTTAEKKCREDEEIGDEIALANELDLLSHIVGNIANEKKQIENNALNISAVHSNHTEIKQSIAAMPDDSDENKILEIRYRWLIANLQPHELGLDDETNNEPDSSLYGHFAFTCVQLNIAINLFGDNTNEWRIFTHANFGLNCLSRRNLEEILRKKVLHFQSQQIDHLKEAQKYLELKNVLLYGYDWSRAADDFHVGEMFLMIKCLQETDNTNKEQILTWIIKILALLVGQKFDGLQGKRILRRCLNLLNAVFPFDEHTAILFDNFGNNQNQQQLIRQLGNLLGRLTHCQHFPYLVRSIDLWRWCYRICKHLEGEINTNVIENLHKAQCEWEEVSNDDKEMVDGPTTWHLPSRTLLLLSKAHEVLGRSRKCAKRQGQFLRLMLDQFASIFDHSDVHNLLNTSKFGDLRENIFHEVIQCLHCAFSANFTNQPKSHSRYAHHHSKLQWTLNWPLARKVLPLLIPNELPEMSSDTRVSFDLIDTISKVFVGTNLLSVEPGRLETIDALCQMPPNLELIERLDADGLWCAYEERLSMDVEGQRRFYELIEGRTSEEGENAMDEVAEMEKDSAKQEELKLKTQIIYLMAHFHNRTGNTQIAKTHLRECLAIGHSHLPAHILSSAWHSFGQTRIFGYTILSDDQLLQQIDAYLFPFKMAIYLNWEFPEAHLDIGTLMYQLRTRLMRFKKQKDTKAESEGDKEIVKKIMQRVEGMLQKARLHFQMAQRFNMDWTKDVGWLTNYFLAKISEKLGESAEKIMQMYYQAALDLESDGVQYPAKINRTKQTYLEAVEIHYKVHSFAMRRLNELMANKSMPLAVRHRELAIIHAYLRLFQHHGVQQRSQDGRKSAPKFYEQCQVDVEKIMEMDEQNKKQTEKESMIELVKADHLDSEEIQLLVKEPSSSTADMEVRIENQAFGQTKAQEKQIKCKFPKVDGIVGAVDHGLEIERLSVAAFETILQRFPHYKAAYRVAENAVKQHRKNHRKASNILFEKLFLAGRKQRSNNFLENVVEIKRTDFERNGSFPYHLFKIVRMAIIASVHCHDLVRMKHLIVALTSYKATTNSSRETLSDKQIRELMSNCCLAFYRLAEINQKECLQDTEKLTKLIEHLEEVLQRLKRDKRFSSTTELESMLIACVRRRDKLAPQPEPDDDIIAIENEEAAAAPSNSSSTSAAVQKLLSQMPGCSIPTMAIPPNVKNLSSLPSVFQQFVQHHLLAKQQQQQQSAKNIPSKTSSSSTTASALPQRPPPAAAGLISSPSSSYSAMESIQKFKQTLPPTKIVKSSHSANPNPIKIGEEQRQRIGENPSKFQLIAASGNLATNSAANSAANSKTNLTANLKANSAAAAMASILPQQQPSRRMTGLPPTAAKYKQQQQKQISQQQNSQQNSYQNPMAIMMQQQKQQQQQQSSSSSSLFKTIEKPSSTSTLTTTPTKQPPAIAIVHPRQNLQATKTAHQQMNTAVIDQQQRRGSQNLLGAAQQQQSNSQQPINMPTAATNSGGQSTSTSTSDLAMEILRLLQRQQMMQMLATTRSTTTTAQQTQQQQIGGVNSSTSSTGSIGHRSSHNQSSSSSTMLDTFAAEMLRQSATGFDEETFRRFMLNVQPHLPSSSGASKTNSNAPSSSKQQSTGNQQQQRIGAIGSSATTPPQQQNRVVHQQQKPHQININRQPAQQRERGVLNSGGSIAGRNALANPNTSSNWATTLPSAASSKQQPPNRPIKTPTTNPISSSSSPISIKPTKSKALPLLSFAKAAPQNQATSSSMPHVNQNQSSLMTSAAQQNQPASLVTSAHQNQSTSSSSSAMNAANTNNAFSTIFAQHLQNMAPSAASSSTNPAGGSSRYQLGQLANFAHFLGQQPPSQKQQQLSNQSRQPNSSSISSTTMPQSFFSNAPAAQSNPTSLSSTNFQSSSSSFATAATQQRNLIVEQFLQMQQLGNAQQLRDRLGMPPSSSSATGGQNNARNGGGNNGATGGKHQQQQQRFG